MKNALKTYAKSLGIAQLGVAPAVPMEDLKNRLLKHRAHFGTLAFTETDLEIRTNPKATMEDVKSIIVCLFPYAGESGGNLSSYAKLPDYHLVIPQYLNKLCDFIKSKKPEAKLLPFTDNGPLVDKHLAYLAGLGFWGKNSLLISPVYGSFVLIGYILTNLSFAPDAPLTASCIGCEACIRACPGGVLGDPNGFNTKRCVSYITQIKEPDAEQKKILLSQNSVYGCDVCQTVCPHNRSLPKTLIREFQTPVLQELSKEELEQLSNRAFWEKYRNFAFSWRGKGVLLKNFSK